MFRGIRPAVVALIAVPTFNLAKSAHLNRYTLWIPIVSALQYGYWEYRLSGLSFLRVWAAISMV